MPQVKLCVTIWQTKIKKIMKSLYPLCAVFLSACTLVRTTPEPKYVVAVDKETQTDPAWQAVVDTLKAKHKAEVVVYDGRAKVSEILPALQLQKPKYVCFVTKPENAGRELVVNIAQTLRKIDDDPYGDALWGIITGYDAADALRLAQTPKARVIARAANGIADLPMFEGMKSGFASSTSSKDDFWVMPDGGTLEKRPTDGNPSKALADAFATMPIDYWVTSGHATQRDWQIVYNKEEGYLRHDEEGNLFFLSPKGEKYPMKNNSPKIYLPAGNCLIGDIDKRSCMATSWIHSGGAEQFCGYTCVTFFGFMGWGVKRQFEEVQCAFSEAHYLQNQLLLWTLAQKKDGTLVNAPIVLTDFGNGREPDKFLRAHYGDVVNKVNGQDTLDHDALGLMWDRDIVAFYGDPAERVTFPESRKTMRVTVDGASVEVTFLKDMTIDPPKKAGEQRPVMTLLDEPPEGTKLVDATGTPVANAVVNDRFLLIPVTGRFAAGDTLRYRLVK